MKLTGLTIMFFGGALIITGLIFFFYDKIPYIGRFLGDIRMKGENSSFYFPLTTCIILSILLNLILRFIRK